MYSDEWAHANNVGLNAANGFYSSNEESGKDFWITTTISEEKSYEVSKLIIQKIEHKCCGKKTMDGFIISYYDGADWKQYQGGKVIKTGQLADDATDLERQIVFNPPLVAQKVKLLNPKTQRSSDAAMGRIEFMLTAPKEDKVVRECPYIRVERACIRGHNLEAPFKNVGLEKCLKLCDERPGCLSMDYGRKTKTCYPNTANEEKLIDRTDYCASDDLYMKNSTCMAEKAPEASGTKAIHDLGSTTEQSSSYSSDWAGKNVDLESKTGFYNSGENDGKSFWITTRFPEGALYDVSQLVMKKITHNCCTKKTMDAYIIEYYDGKEWKKYQDGAAVKTGQDASDPVDKQRVIEFNPPLRASEIKLTNPSSQRSSDVAMGRFDFIITGPMLPKKADEEETKAAPALGGKKAIMDLQSRVS